MARKNKNKKPEYVVICREFNRAAARIDITVIDKGVTDHLLNSLIKLHERDPHKRYFLTLKKDYQVYGALYKKQIETMSIKNNKRIVELGVILDQTKKKGNKHMKNTLSDLNNHLFAQLERLGEEDLDEEEIKKEVQRSKAITDVAKVIVDNGRLALQTMKHMDEYGYNNQSQHTVPEMLEVKR